MGPAAVVAASVIAKAVVVVRVVRADSATTDRRARIVAIVRREHSEIDRLAIVHRGMAHHDRSATALRAMAHRVRSVIVRPATQPPAPLAVTARRTSHERYLRSRWWSAPSLHAPPQDLPVFRR